MFQGWCSLTFAFKPACLTILSVVWFKEVSIYFGIEHAHFLRKNIPKDFFFSFIATISSTDCLKDVRNPPLLIYIITLEKLCFITRTTSSMTIETIRISAQWPIQGPSLVSLNGLYSKGAQNKFFPLKPESEFHIFFSKIQFWGYHSLGLIWQVARQ